MLAQEKRKSGMCKYLDAEGVICFSYVSCVTGSDKCLVKGLIKILCVRFLFIVLWPLA